MILELISQKVLDLPHILVCTLGLSVLYWLGKGEGRGWWYSAAGITGIGIVESVLITKVMLLSLAIPVTLVASYLHGKRLEKKLQAPVEEDLIETVSES